MNNIVITYHFLILPHEKVNVYMYMYIVIFIHALTCDCSDSELLNCWHVWQNVTELSTNVSYSLHSSMKETAHDQKTAELACCTAHSLHACSRTLAQSLETCELVAPCIASNRMARLCCSTLCRGLDYDIIDTVQTLDPHPACTLLTSCLRLVLSLEAASPPPVLHHISACFH